MFFRKCGKPGKVGAEKRLRESDDVENGESHAGMKTWLARCFSPDPGP
jgi:hypothetical protein